MIYEFRTYTLRPTNVPEYLRLAEEVGRPIRGNDFGTNHGYWVSEFGQLNQIWHLWSYADLGERQAMHAELAKNKDWTSKYVANVRPIIEKQEVRFMNGVIDVKPPANEGNLYEYRFYRVETGTAPQWLEAFQEGLKAREKYSPIVGLWHTINPQPHEVSHLWVYPDLNARAAVRAEAAKDKDWRAFLKVGGPMLLEMQSIILTPTAFSTLN